MKTVISTALAGAAGLIRGHGVDPETIARLAHLDATALTETDLILDAEAVLRFLDLAATSCRNRYFGIDLAYCQGWEILGPVWLLARHATNLEDAIDDISEGLQLYSNALVFRGVPEAKGVAYCYDTIIGDVSGELQASELCFAMFCREVRAVAGSQWMPEYVQFRHSPPPSLKRHRQEFGRSVSFNQDRNALLIDYRTLKLPLQHQEKLHGILKRELNRRKHITPESLATRLEMVIRSLISSEACDAETVAASLGMTVRTMQYKLADCDTSYQKILDRVRDTLACKYLRESNLSVAEIAELLQFSETSAFSRFFSQRKGIGPREFRKQCVRKSNN